MKILIRQLSPASSYFLPLRYKYFTQYPVLKYHQSVFFPWCERPSFTPIQCNGCKYVPLYFSL